MRNTTFETNRGEELKFYITETRKQKECPTQKLVIDAYIKNRKSIFCRSYRYAGRLESLFYPKTYMGNRDKAYLARNIDSRGFELRSINEEDYMQVPYSYLGLVEVSDNEQQKGIGSTMLEMQDYLFAKYVDKLYGDEDSVIRGIFMPFVYENRLLTEKFYRKNGYDFVDSRLDLFKDIKPSEVLSNPKNERYEGMKIEEVREF